MLSGSIDRDYYEGKEDEARLTLAIYGKDKSEKWKLNETLDYEETATPIAEMSEDIPQMVGDVMLKHLL